jgi:hypothetical protein
MFGKRRQSEGYPSQAITIGVPSGLNSASHMRTPTFSLLRDWAGD